MRTDGDSAQRWLRLLRASGLVLAAGSVPGLSFFFVVLSVPEERFSPWLLLLVPVFMLAAGLWELRRERQRPAPAVPGATVPDHRVDPPEADTGPPVDSGTDPAGWSLLSYHPGDARTRARRAREARLLLQAQRDHGIPTRQDPDAVGRDVTEGEMRSWLDDPETASAVLLLTRDVENAPLMRSVELPGALDRARRGDGFVALPVLADGMTEAEARQLVGPEVARRLAQVSMVRTASRQLTGADAVEVAVRLLHGRLAAVHRRLGRDAPVRLLLNAFDDVPPRPGTALVLNWRQHFPRPLRTATPETWKRTLLPALDRIAEAVLRCTPGRPVVASGNLPLPAALALGTRFLSVRGLDLTWEQHTRGIQEPVPWSLTAAGPDHVEHPAGFHVQLDHEDPASEDLAVVVSVSQPIVRIFPRTPSRAGRSYRGALLAWHPGRPSVQDLMPEQGAQLAVRIRAVLEGARQEYGRLGRIHLFVAAPAGLAVLLGQLLNTFGEIQLYDFDRSSDEYRPAVLLPPPGS